MKFLFSIILVFVVHICFSQLNLNSGLVAYYPFNGNANDASGNGNNAVFNNATLTADRMGNANSAYHFNGVDNYIRIPNSPSINPSNQISLCAYVKPMGFYKGPCHGNSILMKGDDDYLPGNYVLRFDDNAYTFQNNCNTSVVDTIHQNFYGASAQTPSPGYTPYINKNEWQCMVYTYDGDTAKFYVDGMFIYKQFQPGLAYSNSYDLFLGKLNNPSFPYWLNGDLDEVRIYNRAINDQEVKALCTAVTNTNVITGFNASDTVCVNSPITIQNTSQGASNYFWNFCTANINQPPTGTNLGNVGGLSAPVYIDYVFANGNYYGFVTNNNPGGLLRLDFGNSLLNTPVVTSLGNVGGVIPNNTEGVQIANDNGNWYILIVGGDATAGSNPSLTTVSLGTNIANNIPTATNWGNIGNLSYPHDLYVFNDNGHWFGLTVNYSNSTITRFDLTTSLSNTPTATNLGNIGNLSGPTGIQAINDNGSWRVFVTNATSSTLSRLDFGTSLLNTPTGVNLGNPNNAFVTCWDIYILKYCGQNEAYVINANSPDDIVKLDFGNSLSNTPTAISLGNQGNLDFPHCISKLFRVGADVFSFITNVNNNTLSLLQFKGCTNASIPNSTVQNPPDITYNTPGTYNINLTIDDGLPTQSSFCKQVVVQNCCSINFDFSYKQNVCNPLSVDFENIGLETNNPYWSFGDGNTITGTLTPMHTYANPGNYVVKFSVQNGSCTDTIAKIISVSILPADIISTKDTMICSGSTKQLLTVPSLSFCWSPVTYLDDPLSPNPVTSTPKNITYYFTAEVEGTNIIANGNFNNGNTGFTSEYSYANPNITEGQYFVGASPQAWNSSLSNCTDHTTGSGNMMLVNGSPAPDVNVWKETVTVTPNTNYAFSTWIQALYPPNPAQLSFSINGSDIGNLITASLPTCTWTQFYTTWNSGNNTSATIAIVNKNTFVQGNDFALDDISFSQVSIKRDSVKISVDSPFIKTNNDSAVCAGSKLQLNTSGAVNYTWTPTAGLSNPSIANPVATVNNTTTYFVTGKNNFGCTAKDSVTFTTLPKPTITKSNDTSVCTNNSIQLSANGGTSYSWIPSSTLNNPNINNPVAAPLSTTTYHITVTNAVGCSQTDSIKVVVNNLPNVTKAKDAGICNNASIQLLAGGGSSYSWSPASTLSDPAISNPVATPSITTIYYVIVTNANGCSKKDSIKITTSAPPVITKSSDMNICTNTSVQIFANGGATYTWSPSTSLSNTSVSNPIAMPVTSTTYYVTVTNAYGCSKNDSVKVAINPVPVITISKDTSVCKQASIQLFVSGGNNYLWSPASSLNNPASPTPVASPLVATTYKVTITDAYSCTYEDSVKVGIKSIAKFTVSPDASVCVSTSRQLLASGGDSYLWSPADGLSNTDINNPVATPATTTTYTVTIHEDACNETTTLSTTLTALPLPAINAFSSNDLTCSLGSSQLTATGAESYTWSPAGSLNNSEIANPIASPSSTTLYIVVGKDNDGCTNSDTITVKTDYSMKALYLLPNSFTPNGDGINDCFGIKYWGVVQELDFSIYNRYGGRVFHTNDPNKCWDGTYKQQLQDVNVFVYIIKAKTACGYVDRKGTVLLLK